MEVFSVFYFRDDETWAQSFPIIEFHSFALRHKTGPFYQSFFLIEL